MQNGTCDVALAFYRTFPPAGPSSSTSNGVASEYTRQGGGRLPQAGPALVLQPVTPPLGSAGAVPLLPDEVTRDIGAFQEEIKLLPTV